MESLYLTVDQMVSTDTTASSSSGSSWTHIDTSTVVFLNWLLVTLPQCFLVMFLKISRLSQKLYHWWTGSKHQKLQNWQENEKFSKM